MTEPKPEEPELDVHAELKKHRLYKGRTRALAWAAVALAALSCLISVVSPIFVSQNSAQIGDIQESRVDSTRDNCDAKNESNPDIKKALVKFISTPGHPATKKQKEGIDAFADAIVPPQDCDKVVAAFKERISK